MAIRQLLLFNLDNKTFAVEITDVLSIVPVTRIVSIPDTPDYIEGLINLRGRIHTVFNLRKRFGMPASEFDDDSRIIILNNENDPIGFLADKVNQILRVDDEEIKPAPQELEGLNEIYVKGIVEKDGKNVILADLPAILNVAV